MNSESFADTNAPRPAADARSGTPHRAPVRRFRLVLFASCIALGSDPNTALAQARLPAGRFEVAAGPTWLYANAGHWGGHAISAWQLPGDFSQLRIAAVAVYGPSRRDSTSPGVGSLGLEVAVALVPLRVVPGPNLLLSVGLATTRIDARLQEAASADCIPADGCFDEYSVHYHTGTYWTWTPGLALEVPLSTHLVLRPQCRVLITRKHPRWGTQSVARLDLTLAWSP